MGQSTTETIEPRVPMQVPCKFCKNPVTIHVRVSDWVAFTTGDQRLIQNIFPYLTPADREILISGMCGTCWDKTFATEEY